MNNEPLVSIIIVNYNGKSHLEECLKSLIKIDYNNFEIILVDNNSTDGSREFINKFYTSVKLIMLDSNQGFAEPNNIGAKNAKGEFLLFLNNDTVVTPNFISELIKVINQNPKNVICQSLLLKPNGEVDSSGDFVDTWGRAYSSTNKTKVVKEILSARGASMMTRKDSFFELGGFDKNFFATFEDVDLGWRAWIWGYRVVIAPNSIVYHLGGQTVKNLSSEVKFHGVKNVIILSLVNFETSLAINNIIKHFFAILVKKSLRISIVPVPEQSSSVPSGKIILKGIFWVLQNLKYVLAKRRKVNSRRVMSTKDLLKKGLITSNYPQNV